MTSSSGVFDRAQAPAPPRRRQRARRGEQFGSRCAHARSAFLPITRADSRSIAAVTPGAPKPSSYSLQPTMPSVGHHLDEVIIPPAGIGRRASRRFLIVDGICSMVSCPALFVDVERITNNGSADASIAAAAGRNDKRAGLVLRRAPTADRSRSSPEDARLDARLILRGRRPRPLRVDELERASSRCMLCGSSGSTLEEEASRPEQSSAAAARTSGGHS